MIPDHLKYTSQHEWALITETGTVRFGITDHAQDALGDIVFVTLPEPGSTLTAGETCGEIESTKSVAEIYSPVSESINADPYGGGWLAEVAPADPGALDALLSAAEYEALIAE